MRLIKFCLPVLILILTFSICFAQGDMETRIKNVENGLLPPVIIKGVNTWTIKERLQLYKIPGVSIAVINNFKVEWAKGYGVMDVKTKESVTAQSLFQAASISKPVAAAAALNLVEKGKLSLDKNINNYLKSWKLPDNEHTAKKTVALKHLLSHSGGLTVHGFRGYAIYEEVPSLIDVLNGENSANSAPIRVDIGPEQRYRYSGGGYTVMQLMLIDLLNKPFPEIMKELVLEPAGMINSTYEQPLPADKIKTSAAGHRRGGVPVKGKRHTYPEMAAAGLWTTPADLAKFAVEVQTSLKGKSNKVLSKEMAEKFLTPFVSRGYALGMVIRQYGAEIYFNHGGANEGFRCLLIANKDKGYGAAVMTNSDDGGRIYQEIIRSIAMEYSWGGYLGKVYEMVEVNPSAFKNYTGRYLFNSDDVLTISVEDNKLYIDRTSEPKARLYPAARDTFVMTNISGEYSFEMNSGKKAENLVRKSGRLVRKYKRIDKEFKVPRELLLEGEIEHAVKAYKDLKKTSPVDRNVSENRLNSLGYSFSGQKKYKAALAVFKLNIDLYPESANCYDSYAECFMNTGDNKSAVEYYKKALEIMENYPDINKNYRLNSEANVKNRIKKLESIK